MGRKSLRKNTKKNYRKLASGGDLDESMNDGDPKSCVSDDENGAHGGDQCKQSPNHNKQTDTDDNGGAILNSDDDEDIIAARESLRKLKLERDNLQKKSQLDRILKEREEVERSLKRLKDDKKKGKEVVELNANSLRSMDEVVSKVDKLMDKNLRVGKKISLSSSDTKSTDSSSSDSDSSLSSDSDSDSDSDYSTKKGKGKKKRRSKKKSRKSGKRSGKSKRLTSNVKYPEKWPHSQLSLHFVNKGKKYEELSLAEFSAGYATILEASSDSKKAHRLSHFKELMYLATRYQWRCVLNYHAACLLEIERGRMQWGDNFQVLQNTTLAGGFLHTSSGNRSGGSGNLTSGSGSTRGLPARSSGPLGASGNPPPTPNANREEGILFCRGYQRGLCQKTGDHYGNFYGENRLLKHICAKCWLRMRSLAVHPENSDNCPLKDDL